MKDKFIHSGDSRSSDIGKPHGVSHGQRLYDNICKSHDHIPVSSVPAYWDLIDNNIKHVVTQQTYC